MNLTEALAEFLDDCQLENLEQTTITWYAKMIGSFVAWRGGDTKLMDVTRHEIKDFLKAEQARGLAVESVRGLVRALRRFFNWTLDEELLEQSPMKKVKGPKREKKLPRAVNHDDVLRLLSTCEDDLKGIRDRAIIQTLYDVGCRAGGLLGLCLTDLDYERRVVLLREKDGFRINPVLPETLALLRAWLNVRPQTDTDAVFVGVNGDPQPLQYDGLRTMLLRRGEAAGCEGPVNPHAFRHGFAKEYVLAGGDLFTLADLLGHEDFVMTKNYYAIFGFEELRGPHDKYSPANGV